MSKTTEAKDAGIAKINKNIMIWAILLLIFLCINSAQSLITIKPNKTPTIAIYSLFIFLINTSFIKSQMSEAKDIDKRYASKDFKAHILTKMPTNAKTSIAV